MQTVRKLRTDFKFRSKFSLRAARQRKRFQHEGVGQEVDAGLAERARLAGRRAGRWRGEGAGLGLGQFHRPGVADNRPAPAAVLVSALAFAAYHASPQFGRHPAGNRL